MSKEDERFGLWEEKLINGLDLPKKYKEQLKQKKMSKEEIIKIIDDSLDELLDEVGNDYEYNGCSHLVKIIIDKINQNKDE